MSQPWGPPGQPAPAASAPTLPDGVLDHPVLFDPDAARAVVKAAARNRTWRIVSVFISAAISGALWWFFRDQLGDLTWTWIAVALVIPLVFLLVAIVREIVVRRDARRVGTGLALGIGRRGLYLADTHLPWHEVGAVRARSGRFGASDRLEVVRREGGQFDLPLAFLTASAAGLDSAVFALSGGRVRIDFSRLDA